MNRSTLLRPLALVALLGLVGTACGSDSGTATGGAAAEEEEVPTGPDSPAAGVRAELENLLQEHVYLAAATTGAAVAGRQPEFDAAASALEENSDAITAVVGSVYGPETQETFGPLWANHVGFFVDYASGVAANDAAKASKAVSDLTAYAGQIGTTLEEVTDGGVTRAAVEREFGEHVQTLKAVVDAQKAGDAAQTFAQLRTAADHMTMLAEALAAAIVKQHADAFPGEADNEAADLRARLNTSIQAHTYLTAAATNAALAGRQPEADAAWATLEAESAELAAIVGEAYGPSGQASFDAAWRRHVTLVRDYATATATGDKAATDAARAALTAYPAEFGTAIGGLTSGQLPGEGYGEVLGEHLTGIVAVVDAQKAGTVDQAFPKLRDAAEVAARLADPLANTIVQTFPTEYGQPEPAEEPEA